MTTTNNEQSGLLSTENRRNRAQSPSVLFYCIVAGCIVLWVFTQNHQPAASNNVIKASVTTISDGSSTAAITIKSQTKSDDNNDDDNIQAHSFLDTTNATSNRTSAPPFSSDNNGGQPVKRCAWVIDLFQQNNKHKSPQQIEDTFQLQSTDANVFYRATAGIFWRDFVLGGWHDRLRFETLGIDATFSDGTPLQPKSTWTWVTGDQHLSNFGAWKNRHGDIVYSVNDFDEAAIYDFQVDILRIATSVCSHAHTNNLTETETDQALNAFTDTYVNTLVNYVGGDKEQLFEVTPETSTGVLKDFLHDLSTSYENYENQMEKFTTNNRFNHDEHTRLLHLNNSKLEQNIRDQFTIDKYGATMEHIGWHVKRWSEFFHVVDIARRYGSGVGSYGVDRFYILLEGRDDWSVTEKKKKKKHKKHHKDENNTNTTTRKPQSVILDVKYEPNPAVEAVLSADDISWYRTIFPNPAARAIYAQRHLTSYTDPFTGWIVLDGRYFVVRQRSPWKANPDLDKLTSVRDFVDFMEDVAQITATSHARGTVGKSPAQFKHVISSVLGRHWRERQVWGEAVNEVARDYRHQVLLDYECFRDYVKSTYG